MTNIELHPILSLHTNWFIRTGELGQYKMNTIDNKTQINNMDNISRKYGLSKIKYVSADKDSIGRHVGGFFNHIQFKQKYGRLKYDCDKHRTDDYYQTSPYKQ